MVVESMATRASLILRIRDTGDQEAWREYVLIYKPRIEKWARRWVRTNDVDDVVQIVLHRVAQGASSFIYDTDKGKYRAWLKTVAHNVARDVLNKESRQPVTNGQTDESDPMAMVVDDSAGDSLLEFLEDGERVELFRQAERQTRDESNELEWQSYHQSVYLIPKREPLEIAESLGIKVGNYYKCRSVFVKRLKENFKELDQ